MGAILVETKTGIVSPQGVVIGERGFKYKDTVTNNIYECLGGTDWRITHISGVPISNRRLSYDKLLTLEDFIVGETVHVIDRNAELKVIHDVKPYSVYLEGRSGNKDYIHGALNTPKVMTDADEIRFTFMIKDRDEIETGVYDELYFLETSQSSGTGIRISIRPNTTDDTTFTVLALANWVTDVVYTENGNIVAKNEIPYGEYVTVIGHVSTSITLTEIYLNTHKSNADWNQFINIKEFTFKDERFSCDEAAGTDLVSDLGSTLIIKENNATGGMIPSTNTSLWEAVSYKSLEKHIIGEYTLELTPINNTATPQMYGAIPGVDNVDYTNDSSEAIQQLFDSKYNVDMTPNLFYITKELTISRAKDIKMYGSSIANEYSTSSLDEINSLYSRTILYSNVDINFITIAGSNINVYNGYIDASKIVDWNGYGFGLDLAGRIYGGGLHNVNVLGNEDNFHQVGVGCGVGIKLLSDKEYTSHPYVTSYKISGYITSCGISLHCPPKSAGATANNLWINSIKVELRLNMAKEFISVHEGSLWEFDSAQQDSATLMLSEAGTYANTFNCHRSTIDVFCWDRVTTQSEIDLGKYRHENNFVYTDSDTNEIKGKTMPEWGYGYVNAYNINKNAVVRDPKRLVISDNVNSVISGLDNQIRYAGVQGTVLFRGFKAPNSAWFEANTFPADDVLNTTPLTEDDGTNIVIHDNGLLTFDGDSRRNYYDVLDTVNPELCFAEIEIPIPVLDTIFNIYLRLDTTYAVDSLQLMTFGTDDALLNTQILDYKNIKTGIHQLNQNLAIDLDGQVAKILIRIIGYQGEWLDSGDSVNITDIIATSRFKRNNPVISIGGGQKIYGDLEVESLTINEDSLVAPAYGGCGMQSNTTVTTIAVASTYYKAGGTTIANLLKDFTHTSGRLTYTGAKTRNFRVSANPISMISTSNNVIVRMKIAKNGIVVGYPMNRKIATGSDIGSGSVAFDVSLATNDYVELFVTNITSATNVTVQSMYLSIQSL